MNQEKEQIFKAGGNSSAKKNTNTTTNDLEQIKEFLQTLGTPFIYNVFITTHKTNKQHYQEANYNPRKKTLFTDESIQKEIQSFKEEIIKKDTKTPHSPEKESHKSPINPYTLSSEPIFQTLYKNEQKNRIKNILAAIPTIKLNTLKLLRLDPHKKDKYNKLFPTNYKNTSTGILYYREEDLPIINEFIYRQRKGIGYAVIKKRSDKKWFNFDGKEYPLSPNTLFHQENNTQYYLDLKGKKYYKLLIERNQKDGTIEKEPIVLDHTTQLSPAKIKEINQLQQQLTQRFDIKTFEKIQKILIENSFSS
ncbi:hypothetical protein [Candidatus Phytoplasma pruni]|uniref:Uncharacterized protein n=1 Tax=Candidatus Phytoplasma pruni TaxID=479893 RepID=A0A851HGZ6_9MOLU|nr:hypothetical protein [Candidatus Phytoplasma pruni]NWN45890.1 hypothetical protein [Candidatus Phytoplasma pruni]